MPEPQKLITRCLSTALASISIHASMASQEGLLATPEPHSQERHPGPLPHARVQLRLFLPAG